jgi:hypothetical protein
MMTLLLLLLTGSLQRLGAMDSLAIHEALEPPPRVTYCCDDKYGLPGGSTTLTVQLEDIWEQVSGSSRGLAAGSTPVLVNVFRREQVGGGGMPAVKH